ncbi:hypothetical protein QBC35DRAFT_484362 [Podospora australis]|uniref:Uncharacterized protein n=1 Tax=Podospora australis TaxID=1536484 RepID=A0AAN6X773_9PEZI|nr:hypothetical protein QBC35DRAFT_484362 [Podospora australis]
MMNWISFLLFRPGINGLAHIFEDGGKLIFGFHFQRRNNRKRVLNYLAYCVWFLVFSLPDFSSLLWLESTFSAYLRRNGICRWAWKWTWQWYNSTFLLYFPWPACGIFFPS